MACGFEEREKFTLFFLRSPSQLLASPPLQYFLRPMDSARLLTAVVFIAAERLLKDSLFEFNGGRFQDHHGSLCSP